MAPRTPAACPLSVDGVTAAAAADIVVGAHCTGTGPPRISPADLVTQLVVAGIGAVRSLVLAVGVWIELRTVAGIADYLLRGRRRCDRSGKEAATPSKANFVMGILLKG